MKKKVAVLFGGMSPEHEVSIISGIQTLNAIDTSKYEVFPVYVTRKGKWYLGGDTFSDPMTFKDETLAVKSAKNVSLVRNRDFSGLVEVMRGFQVLKTIVEEEIDVFVPVFHGKNGEDGSIQGLFELNGVAYTGCNVHSSAVGMDKVTSKILARSVSIPVLEDYWFTKEDYGNNKSRVISKLVKSVGFPMYVKPARLGSTIGISRVKMKKSLSEAIDVALFYDDKVLVEKELVNTKEIQISILGNSRYEFSACEQPISGKGVLTFDDKYISGDKPSEGMASAKRIVPAKIKKTTEKVIKDYSEKFFRMIGGTGLARIDFLVTKDEKKVYFNEINTIPGSLSFFLWEEVDVSFSQLMDKMINLAIERRKEKDKLVSTFKSSILDNYGGAKGQEA